MLNFGFAVNVSTVTVFVTHLLVDESEILELNPTQPPPPLHVGFLCPTALVLVALWI